MLLRALSRGEKAPAREGVLVSAIEHPSVRENALILKQLGMSVGFIEPERDGRITASALDRALKKQPAARFVSVMLVNNETGAIMDMENLVKAARTRGGAPIHFHSDMVQAAGKIPLNLNAWDLDSAAFSAHKIGGPRGIGLLYIRKPLRPLYAGGGQEGGMRPGTENIAGALDLAECLERRAQAAAETFRRAAGRWRDLILALKGMERCTLIPPDREAEDPRFSPWILQAAFRGIPGEVMVRALDDAGFAISTGSACSSSRTERPVLAAMGVDPETAFQGVRISQGWTTSSEAIGGLIGAVRNIVKVL
jgi:cysteine desulfurase